MKERITRKGASWLDEEVHTLARMAASRVTQQPAAQPVAAKDTNE